MDVSGSLNCRPHVLAGCLDHVAGIAWLDGPGRKVRKIERTLFKGPSLRKQLPKLVQVVGEREVYL